MLLGLPTPHSCTAELAAAIIESLHSVPAHLQSSGALLLSLFKLGEAVPTEFTSIWPVSECAFRFL